MLRGVVTIAEGCVGIDWSCTNNRSFTCLRDKQVPAVMSDRYARLHHGFEGEKECYAYSVNDKPQACYAGSADAQNAVATEQLISNALTFFTSSLIGSLSDEHGRRRILLLGVLMSCLSPLFLLLTQLNPTMSPVWYYGVGAMQGLINWIAVALSALSDVMPKQWRAPSFGLLLAGFSFGFALAPQLALLLGHFNVTIMSLSMVLLGLIVVFIFFPETLPREASERASLIRSEQRTEVQHRNPWLWAIYRPLWELTILNRSKLFRLLSALAFFSGIVSSGDRTLLIYYLEDRLDFNDKDVAKMFLILGVLGIFVQGVVLKILNDKMGERRLVMFCFLLGTVHNTLYGLAEDKRTIFIAVAIGSFVSMAFPTISAIKSNNVDPSEQGRIQGALYSLSALASALGPMTLRFVYHYTKDGALAGPGSMFLFAGALYAVASYCAYLLPVSTFTYNHYTVLHRFLSRNCLLTVNSPKPHHRSPTTVQ